MTPTDIAPHDFAGLLRWWRQRRRLSQLDLSLHADVSTRHLSFLETGRSAPSRDMVLRLAERLELPLRERNMLLTAAGYAQAYSQRPIEAPEMGSVRDAIEQVLAGHEPYPAIAVDRCWNLVSANRPAALFVEGLPEVLLGPPANVYRMSLHPDGLAPRIVNLTEFAQHLLGQLRHDVDVSGDPQLAALLAEVEAYPGTPAAGSPSHTGDRSVVTPMRLRHPAGELALFTTIATFGTPVDVTVDELAIEAFFPADRVTADRLAALAAG